jgi:hypothetical protein
MITSFSFSFFQTNLSSKDYSTENLLPNYDFILKTSLIFIMLFCEIYFTLCRSEVSLRSLLSVWYLKFNFWILN